MVSEHGANEPAFDRGRVIAAGCGLYLAPLAGRGRRALARRVRGPLRESGLVERPPHPDPLHSPSQTGVNALMASGERAKKCRASSGSLVPQRKGRQARSLAIATIALVIAWLPPFALTSVAQDWPGHLVRIVVPAAAGGSSDAAARLVTNHFQTVFRQPFIIENKPGKARPYAMHFLQF